MTKTYIHILFAKKEWQRDKALSITADHAYLVGTFEKERRKSILGLPSALDYMFKLYGPSKVYMKCVGEYMVSDENHKKAYLLLHANRVGLNMKSYIAPFGMRPNCLCGAYVPSTLQAAHLKSIYHRHNVEYLSSKLISIRTFIVMSAHRFRLNYKYCSLIDIYLMSTPSDMDITLFENLSFVERRMWGHWLTGATRMAIMLTKKAAYVEYRKFCHESSEYPLVEHNFMIALKACGAITCQNMIILPDHIIRLINGSLFRDTGGPLSLSIESALHNGEVLDLLYGDLKNMGCGSFPGMADSVRADFFIGTIYHD